MAKTLVALVVLKQNWRDLQQVICSLHLDELPLRHIFHEFEGATRTRVQQLSSFSGPIGRQLHGSASAWAVEIFQPITNPEFPQLPSEIVENLSNYQFYAYKICRAVTSGVVDEDLKQPQVGGLGHSRWLTLGCRILRFYISEHNPSNSLQAIAKYLVKVYFSCWFDIKQNNKLTEGSKFFSMLKKNNDLLISRAGELLSKYFKRMLILRITSIFY